MLVITRRLNQSVNIFTEGDERIAVEIVEVRGDQVRLGIAAPGGYAIERAEVTRDLEAEAAVMGVPAAAYCAEKRQEMARRRIAHHKENHE